VNGEELSPSSLLHLLAQNRTAFLAAVFFSAEFRKYIPEKGFQQV
jgi:hypothetical protein